MGKSARILGYEFSKSAREMNGLFKDHGYLEGEPGAYELTEKGKGYAEEQYQRRGTGGYAHYNRDWTTRTWNDETAAALRADMAARPQALHLDEASPDDDEDLKHDVQYSPPAIYGSGVDDDPPSTFVVVLGAAFIGACVVAPHVKPFWNEKLQPRMTRMRDKLTKRAPVRTEPAENVDG